MAVLPTLTTFVAYTKAIAQEVNDNFTALRSALSTLDGPNNMIENAITAREHSDMSSSTDTFHSAESIEIADSGGMYSSDNVEDALQTIGGVIGLDDGSLPAGTGIIRFVDYDYEAEKDAYADCSVTIPANTASTGLLVTMTAMNRATAGVWAARYISVTIKVGSNDAENMSSFGSEDYRFQINASGDDNKELSREMVITAATTSGLTHPFDPSEETVITFQQPWTAGGAKEDLFEHYTLVAKAF